MSLSKVVFKINLILILLLLLSGCSSLSGPLFKKVSLVPEDQAVIYIYRNKDVHNTDFLIKYNDSEICVLKNNGYFPLLVREGKTVISSQVQFKMFATGLLDIAIGGTSELVLKAEPGKSYYLKCWAGQMNGQRLTINLVPENFGSNDIKECKLLDPLNTPGKSQNESTDE